MNSNTVRKIGFYFSGFALLLAIGLTLYNQAQKGLWQAEVRRSNEHWAYWEARKDFVNGRLRLLRSEGDNSELKFSGQHEGPFEIWIPEYYPSLSEASRFSHKTYVEWYNTFMRSFLVDANSRAKEKTNDAPTGNSETNATRGNP